MKIKIIAAVLGVSVLMSSFALAETQSSLRAFSNAAVIDGHVFNNTGLQYPFLMDEDSIYMPLDYKTLRTLGYLSSWDNEAKSFRIYATTNRTYNMSTSEVNWSAASISGQQSPASLNWMNEAVLEGQLIEANGILYLKLSEDVLAELDWAAAYHPVIGLQLSVVEGSADLVEFSDVEVAYYDGLARFMLTKNADLSYEKAAEYVKYIREASAEYGIDEIWIMAMLWQESWYDENCEYKGALGLMQIMESTGRALGLTREQLFDPQMSIHYGVKYLSDQMEAFDGNLDLATLAYNQGPVRVSKGTYRTWYLEDVKEKSDLIKQWLSDQGAALSSSDEGDQDQENTTEE